MSTLQGSVNVSSVKLWRGGSSPAIYIGRGPAPSGMEAAGLGNPFVVGQGYAQGEAVIAYEHWLREQCRTQTNVYHKVIALARRVAAGEHLTLICWCKGKGGKLDTACHGDVLRRAILGYAQNILAAD